MESPTGTGKTLSLLTGVMEAVRILRENPSAKIDQSKPFEPDPEFEEDDSKLLVKKDENFTGVENVQYEARDVKIEDS